MYYICGKVSVLEYIFSRLLRSGENIFSHPPSNVKSQAVNSLMKTQGCVCNYGILCGSFMHCCCAARLIKL